MRGVSGAMFLGVAACAAPCPLAPSIFLFIKEKNDKHDGSRGVAGCVYAQSQASGARGCGAVPGMRKGFEMAKCDPRLYWMGEAQETAEDLIDVIEALCAMCAAAGIDFEPYLLQVLGAIAGWLEI